jgi:xanthine dehydrogenase YagS FAD-binding subunit
MRPFELLRPESVQSAILHLRSTPNARIIAGGTNIIDLMKDDVERPEVLVDVTRLPLADVVVGENGSLRIGALVRNSDLAFHPDVEAGWPLISAAILAGASPQLRNMATTGGNILQRTRCPYFYDRATACNKRVPGEGCSAIEGVNRTHAVLGTSADCVATHPSDLCIALAALEATVTVEGPSGRRRIAFEEFHRLPGDRPDKDTTLGADEIVTEVEVPASFHAQHWNYLKLRDRTSYAFALVSVAAALEIVGGTISSARIALGGLAHKPWRCRDAENVLVGMQPEPDIFRFVASIALKDARPLRGNAFKVELAQRAIFHALSKAASGAPPRISGLSSRPIQ